MGAKSGGMKLGLILPPQSGAASDSICFKYMDRGVWGSGRAMALVGDATEKKRKGEADTIPHILRRDTTTTTTLRINPSQTYEGKRETDKGRKNG